MHYLTRPWKMGLLEKEGRKMTCSYLSFASDTGLWPQKSVSTPNLTLLTHVFISIPGPPHALLFLYSW